MKFTSGSLVSVFIHGFVLFVLIVGLPKLSMEPEKPKAIQVELVPPPKKVKPKPVQKPKPIARSVPELKKTNSGDRAKIAPPQILHPVYKFGEKDAGTNKPSDEGAVREKEVVNTSRSKELVKERGTRETAVSTPSVSQQETVKTSISRPSKPVFRPAKSTKPRKTARSRSKAKAAVTTTAKNDLKRGIRVGQLCVTELRSQLNRSNPPYWPDRLPTYRLYKGSVLVVNKAAFRENARWINLKFRCEVDKAATVVVAFNFNVGSAIPRSQWANRGLPGT